MFEYYNENPKEKNVGDCTVRAICKATGEPWGAIYAKLCAKGYEMADMPDSNAVWGAYLAEEGYKRHILPNTCPACYTVSDFAEDHKEGTYIVGTGTHVVCVKDGCIFDSWNSSDKVPVYYFSKE